MEAKRKVSNIKWSWVMSVVLCGMLAVAEMKIVFSFKAATTTPSIFSWQFSHEASPSNFAVTNSNNLLIVAIYFSSETDVNTVLSYQ